MSTAKKWRVAHLDSNDVKSYEDFVAQFNQAYATNNQPAGMAMFSHTDGIGRLMAVSITPASVPYCPFADTWSEDENTGRFGNVGWVARDVSLK